MAERDYYEILGISRTASQDEIQRAYRRLARRYHPDVNKDPEAEERFKDITEAYNVLRDPETRRRYDAFGPEFRQVPPDVDPETWAGARRARAGAGRAGAGGGWSAGFGSFGDIDLEDLFGGWFTGGRGFGPVRGPDQEAELVLSVEEAYRGGRRSIMIPRASGSRRYDVTIPPGVTEGQRIRLAGQGGQGIDGGPPGDLYLIVRLASHPRYRVDGRDLYVDLPLAPWEAALGTTVPVETPGGEAKVRVPPGTSTGRRLRLRGRGLRSPRGEAGDLYAEVKIAVPAELTPEERRLWEELAATSAFDPRRTS
ncbi:DnaJ C-terminal domain-containing protein [Thermasporomyces composti]|uniref:Curved DNA-binding protein n=1 Tax=Thermasporomyces composti TaxID=696763 RepID=A0A3D9V5K8_THECX|nr:DnaJ C-terminal domain-containing protein [Thermasporomyces composti]REF35450.1 curved DNA-binding protein [Thermasporomyces composti]